ncbi:hypothetical protein BpHYR1_053067 [Brachionus plicatilis]|uniref:Uncharacterized protein n=1 Tax=Brachionus plicatilis TaxID=10195 RepID=A0A3M7PSI8_BRAPC|nr:hypothetical protein BpHYR1_053067 [Brachionus plicatilis]
MFNFVRDGFEYAVFAMSVNSFLGITSKLGENFCARYIETPFFTKSSFKSLILSIASFELKSDFFGFVVSSTSETLSSLFSAFEIELIISISDKEPLAGNILNHDISYTLLLQPSHNIYTIYKSGQKDPSVFLYLGLERIKMDKKGHKDPTGFLVLKNLNCTIFITVPLQYLEFTIFNVDYEIIKRWELKK